VADPSCDSLGSTALSCQNELGRCCEKGTNSTSAKA